MTLNQLAIGQRATVERVEGDAPIVQRLLEMGLFEGEEVQVIAVAPFGDPIEVRLRDYRLSLRRNEAAMVRIGILN